jgi:hypothetical protein
MLHEKPHVLFAHVGWPLVMPGHMFPHVRQFCAFELVSTHEPLQSVGMFAGQPDTHENDPAPFAEHTGVAPLHIVVQLPHDAGVDRSTSQPSSGFPLQSENPATHADAGNEHAPAVHGAAPLTCGRFVQS